MVNEENFKTIYSQFFPQGGKMSALRAEPAKLQMCCFIYTILSVFVQALRFRREVYGSSWFSFVEVLFHHRKEMNLINSQ